MALPLLDVYSTQQSGLDSPARNFAAKVVAGNAVDYTATSAQRPRALYINTAGNLVITGENGVQVTFAVLAGTILPISPVIISASTTCDVIPLW